jgi:hypothetical protein
LSKIKAYPDSENPTREAIIAIDPTVISMLSQDYNGKNSDPRLAKLFVESITEAGSYDALNIVDSKAIPPEMEKGNARKFANRHIRFNKNNNDFGIYYDFLNIFATDSLTDEQLTYAVSIIKTYGNKTRNGVLNTLNSIYAYKVETLGEKRDIIPLSELENLFALSNVLRKEGIQIGIAHLWICSTHWTTSEVVTMISEGLEIRKAVELYTMGFKTMDEILEYGVSIPDSWLNRLLNGPPKKKNQI